GREVVRVLGRPERRRALLDASLVGVLLIPLARGRRVERTLCGRLLVREHLVREFVRERARLARLLGRSVVEHLRREVVREAHSLPLPRASSMSLLASAWISASGSPAAFGFAFTRL